MAFTSRKDTCNTNQNSTSMILASGPTSQIQELFSDKHKQVNSIQPLPLACRTQKQEENYIQLSSPAPRTCKNSTPNSRKRQTHNSSIKHDETVLESKKRKEQDVVGNDDEISLIMTADDQDQDEEEETEEQTRETPNVAEHTREAPNVVPQISDKEVMNSSYYEDIGLPKLKKRNNSIDQDNSCSKLNNSSNNSNSVSNSKNSNNILTICEYILTSLVKIDNRLKVIEDKQDELIESVTEKNKTDVTDEDSLEEDVGDSRMNKMDRKLKTIEEKQNKLIKFVAKMEKTKSNTDETSLVEGVDDSRMNKMDSRLKTIEEKQNKLIEFVAKMEKAKSNTDETSLVEDAGDSPCTIEENDQSWSEEEDEAPADRNEMLKNTTCTTDEPTADSTDSENCQTIVSEEPSKKGQQVQSTSAKNMVAKKSSYKRKWKDIQADQEHRNPLLTGLKVYSKKEETANVAGIVSPDESILSTHTLKMLFLQALSPGNFAVLILRKIKPELEQEHVRRSFSWRGSTRTKKKPISLTARKFIKKCMVSIYPDTEEHENFQPIVETINESLRRKSKKAKKKD